MTALRRLIPLVFAVSLLAVAQDRGAAPATAQEYLQRGEERAGAHDWKGAFADYNMALQSKPDYAEAYNDRGHAYYWTGQYEQAIADFTRAIELRPNYPNAFNNRGAAYMASAKYRGDPRMVADFDQAIRLKPDFRNAYVNRANATLGSNWRGALDDFHRGGVHPERTVAVAAAVLLLLAGIGTFGLVKLRKRMLTIGRHA